MNTLNEFEAHATSIGYAQVLVKEWQPNLQLETHAHPFAVHVEWYLVELIQRIARAVLTNWACACQ